MRKHLKRIAALYIGSVLAACNEASMSPRDDQIVMNEKVELSSPMDEIPIDDRIRVKLSDVVDTTGCEDSETCDEDSQAP